MNLLSKVTSFVKGRANLVFGYALIAALITLGGFTATLWMRNADMKLKVSTLNTSLVTTQGEVTTLKGVTETQSETINTLHELRQKDATTMLGLMEDVSTIRGRHAATSNRVLNLEMKNAKVKTYLDIALPPELQCVLDDACADADNGGGETSTGTSTKGPNNPVQGPRAN